MNAAYQFDPCGRGEKETQALVDIIAQLDEIKRSLLARESALIAFTYSCETLPSRVSGHQFPDCIVRGNTTFTFELGSPDPAINMHLRHLRAHEALRRGK